MSASSWVILILKNWLKSYDTDPYIFTQIQKRLPEIPSWCQEQRNKNQWPRLMEQTLNSHCRHHDFPNPSSKKHMTQFSCHFRVIKPNLEAIHIVLMIQEASLHMSYGLTFFLKNIQIPYNAVLSFLSFAHQKPLFSMHFMWNTCPRTAVLEGKFCDFLSWRCSCL